MLAVESPRDSVPDAERQSLTKRARRGLDAGRHALHWMSLHAGVDLTQRHDLLDREVPALAERGVEDRHSVALGEDEAVTVGPPRIVRVMLEHAAEVER